MSSTGTIIVLLITIILLALGFMGTKRVNAKKLERPGQFIIPFFALAFCLVIMPFVDKLMVVAMAIVGVLGTLLSGLSNIALLPLQLPRCRKL